MLNERICKQEFVAHFKGVSQVNREGDSYSVFYRHIVGLCSCTNLLSNEPGIRTGVQLLKYLQNLMDYTVVQSDSERNS
jgi:hypothetical protein